MLFCVFPTQGNTTPHWPRLRWGRFLRGSNRPTAQGADRPHRDECQGVVQCQRKEREMSPTRRATALLSTDSWANFLRYSWTDFSWTNFLRLITSALSWTLFTLIGKSHAGRESIRLPRHNPAWYGFDRSCRDSIWTNDIQARSRGGKR